MLTSMTWEGEPCAAGHPAEIPRLLASTGAPPRSSVP
jgi:hypothetical protein